jgi:anti-anti-sigma factor
VPFAVKQSAANSFLLAGKADAVHGIGRIETIDEAGAHVVVLSGEHDLSTAGDVRRALDDAFGRGSAVVLDLTDAGFIDSSVLGQIAMGAERAISVPEHSFAVVVMPGGSVDRLVRLVGLTQIVMIFPTRAEAIAAIS